MFLGVGWGAVGWGNNVHVLAHSHDVRPRHVHLHVRTYVMLRWRCVTSRWGGVGWGNNVHVLAHSHDVTPRHVHLHVRTYIMLRWRCVTSRRGGVGWRGVGRGGVGWGNNVHVLVHSHDVRPRHVHLHVRTYVMLRWRCVTSRWGGVGWGGAITFTYLRTHMMLGHGTFTCLLRWRKCYPGLTSANKLIHFACSHRKNQFVKKIRRHAGKTFWGYTGTIDSCWRMIKASAPDQLTSCPENEQKLNDLIWTYVRTWQWRWEANVVGKPLLEKTGAYLAKM